MKISFSKPLSLCHCSSNQATDCSGDLIVAIGTYEVTREVVTTNGYSRPWLTFRHPDAYDGFVRLCEEEWRDSFRQEMKGVAFEETPADLVGFIAGISDLCDQWLAFERYLNRPRPSFTHRQVEATGVARVVAESSDPKMISFHRKHGSNIVGAILNLTPKEQFAFLDHLTEKSDDPRGFRRLSYDIPAFTNEEIIAIFS